MTPPYPPQQPQPYGQQPQYPQQPPQQQYQQPGQFQQPAPQQQAAQHQQAAPHQQPVQFQQPYPQATGGGRLVVNSSYNPMAFLLALTGPKIEVNGQPVQAKWGDWPIDLPAGNYTVRVSTRYLGEMGPAQTGVTVYPGQQVTVFYRPPAAMGMGGSIGFHPQKTRGMPVLLGIMAVLIVLMLLPFLLI